MKWVLLVLGILFVLVGGVWVLQGSHVLTQGSMAGKSLWTLIGSIVGAVGVVLVVVGATIRRRKAA